MRRYAIIFGLLVGLFALTLTSAVQAAGNCGGLPLSGEIPAGTYTFSIGCVHTLTGALTVSGGQTVTIDGQGGQIVGDGTNSALSVTGSTLNLNNITITGAGNTGVVAGSGSTVNADYVTLTGNNGGWGAGLTAGGTGAKAYINYSLITNNNGSAGGGVAVSNGGSLTMRNSCLYGNTASIGSNAYSGPSFYQPQSLDLAQNWWNGPATGVGIYGGSFGTGSVITSPELTSAPSVCGSTLPTPPPPPPSSGGSTATEPTVTLPPDARVNWQYGDLNVVVYSHEDGAAVYCYNADAKVAWLGMHITQEVVDNWDASQPQDVPVLEVNHDGCHTAFYILDSGEYQINIWGTEGKYYEIISHDLHFSNAVMHHYDPNE